MEQKTKQSSVNAAAYIHVELYFVFSVKKTMITMKNKIMF